MKRISVMILAAALLISITSVLAAEGGLDFTMIKLQDTAAENSRQAVVDELTITQKQNDLEDAMDDANETGSGITRSTALANKITKTVSIMEAEAALEIAKMTEEENLEDLKVDVYEQALKILLMKKELETEKEKYEILKEQCDIQKSQYENGTLAATDLYDIQYDVEAEEISISKIEKEIQKETLELKNLLNVELDEEYIGVNEELKFEPVKVENIDELIEKAIEESIDVYTKAEAQKAMEKQFELTKEYYYEGENTYEINRLELESAKLDLEDAKKDLKVEIRNKYNELLNAQDSVEVAESYEELTADKLEVAQLKYDKGIISKEDLLTAEETKIEAIYQKYSAIYDYSITAAEFDSLIN